MKMFSRLWAAVDQHEYLLTNDGNPVISSDPVSVDTAIEDNAWRKDDRILRRIEVVITPLHVGTLAVPIGTPRNPT
jgi:hypothetical protein